MERARVKAKLDDWHFHDLRHMAITRLAEKLPNLIELSAVSGHKSLAMLRRYYHPNPELLAEKLG
jgi:integrase